MNKEQILEMLKEIVEEIDYDIYKEIFVHSDEDTEGTQFVLTGIVEKHLQKAAS